MIIVTSLLSRSFVFNMFSVHMKLKATFTNSCSLKSGLEKLRFRDGLVSTVGLIVEIKLSFRIPQGLCVEGALQRLEVWN